MKKDLRKILLEKRKKLSYEDVLKKSRIIEKKLINMHEYKISKTILFYISYNNEVYTHDMIKKSLIKGKNIIVPISDKKNKTIVLSKLDEWEDLTPGSYNILEPKKEHIKVTYVDIVDLIIVPGLGFDICGYRIGHGMGYFDKLLKYSKYCKYIGLAFEFQILDKIPIENHDIPVNKIITEERTIICFDYHLDRY